MGKKGKVDSKVKTSDVAKIDIMLGMVTALYNSGMIDDITYLKTKKCIERGEESDI